MFRSCLLIAALVSAQAALSARAAWDERSPKQTPSRPQSFLGFDRNQYPGDENLTALRRTFDYTGFWLNNPPGAKGNGWAGKRSAVTAAGFGFLVLFKGRLDTELRKAGDAAALGKSDAAEAVAAAKREGFAAGTVIFLDLEEGGRMLPEQKAYIFAWVDSVSEAGFRAGIYCSGIPALESHGVVVVTAEDIQQNAAGRNIVYWVANDACPPSPGCSFPHPPPAPVQSGVRFADVWQFTQSPRRKDVARGCKARYSCDGNCYPPYVQQARRLFLDVNSATSADPSGGRLGGPAAR